MNYGTIYTSMMQHGMTKEAGISSLRLPRNMSSILEKILGRSNKYIPNPPSVVAKANRVYATRQLPHDLDRMRQILRNIGSDPSRARAAGKMLDKQWFGVSNRYGRGRDYKNLMQLLGEDPVIIQDLFNKQKAIKGPAGYNGSKQLHHLWTSESPKAQAFFNYVEGNKDPYTRKWLLDKEFRYPRQKPPTLAL